GGAARLRLARRVRAGRRPSPRAGDREAGAGAAAAWEKVLQGVLGHRANGRIGTAECRRGTRGRALDELANGLIPEMLAGVRFGDRDEYALARMLARESQDALNKANGTDAASGQRRICPL